MLESEINKLAQLASIAIDTDQKHILTHDIASIMHFIQQLQSIDTTNIKPMTHPLDASQPLREDVVTERSHVQDLAQIAPSFENDVYLVPKVIDIINE